MASRLHIELATGKRPFPKKYSTYRLSTQIRGLMMEHTKQENSSSASFLETLPDNYEVSQPGLPGTGPVSMREEVLYAHIVRDYVRQDMAFWTAHHMGDEVMNHRLDLLKTLCTSNTVLDELRSRALDHVSSNLDYFSGWMKVLQEGKRFQLGEHEPWWRQGDFIKNELAREALVQSGKSPREGKFYRVSREHYLNRVKVPIIRILTSSPDFILAEASLIALFTSSRHERQDIARLTEALRMIVFGQAQVSLRERSTAIPMQPLYSLPREMRNLGSFFITREELQELDQDELSDRIYNRQSGASAKRHKQSLLFYDSDLVARGVERPNQYIEVELTEDNASIVDALIQAIEVMGVGDDILLHLPRIVAGFFNAAQRDRQHDFGADGVFWDTESGKRLCNIIGFDSENKRHRKRIQDARQLMQNIILHREVVELQDDGKTYKKVAWRGPLIEQRREELSVEIGTSEGITAHSTFEAWQIASALWKMITPRFEGGTPSFMLLDERAFSLDKKSSIPFNLYWTIVNRAYIAKLGSDGNLKISVKTLYRWSGLEGRFQRTSKLKDVLKDALEKMVLQDLISSWKCSALQSRKRQSLDDLLEEQLEIIFSSTQLESLGHLIPDGLLESHSH